MTDLTGYTAEQALNRDLPVNAVNGASLHRACVHGYSADGAPEEVLAEGIHLGTRAVWSVDLDDIDRAVTVLIDQPLTYAHPDRISDPQLLTLVSSSLAVAREAGVTTDAEIPGVADGVIDYDPPAFEQLVVDVVFQIATLGEVIRAAAADHSERRARALIARGIEEATAVAQAADEAIESTRRTVQIARQCRALVELVDAYAAYGTGSTYRLLRDLGDHLNLSIAYVDRATIEAHLERILTAGEWAATSGQFHALDFDEHVGDANTFRTDWIESVLDKAGVPGYGCTADGEVA